MEQKQGRRWIVRGMVQGVGFRFFAREKAVTLGVTGWARNLDDGSVEVCGFGKQGDLHELGAALHLGPGMSQVRGVEEQVLAYEPKARGFAIR